MQKLNLFRPRRSFLFDRCLGVLLTAALVLSLTPLPQLDARAAPAVFINEIHYDNIGTDAGEAIEIAGPAGTDLTGIFVLPTTGATYDGDKVGRGTKLGNNCRPQQLFF